MRAAFGDRPAMRHKDLGIWQTLDLGAAARRGPRLCGRPASPRPEARRHHGDRRRQPAEALWSVMAAQALGAVPVPVYADAVADELAYVLAHAEVRFAAVEDQEQVDKILSVSDRLPKLETMVYDETRGLRDYDHSQAACDRRRHRRRPQGAGGGRRRSRAWLDARDRGRQGLRHLDHPLHLRHHRPIQGRGAVGRALHRRRLRHRRLRQADREATRRWPICRSPGSATIISTTRRGWSRASAWPARRAATPRWPDLREIGPTFFFAPPRTFEQMLTRVMIRMEDAGFLKRRMFHYFIGVARRYGEKILNRQPVPLHGRLLYCARQHPGLRAAEERARALAACASPTPRARRSAPTCSRSTARSA